MEEKINNILDELYQISEFERWHTYNDVRRDFELIIDWFKNCDKTPEDYVKLTDRLDFMIRYHEWKVSLSKDEQMIDKFNNYVKELKEMLFSF